MIDLSQLCAHFTREPSSHRTQSQTIIAAICALLQTPSPRTAELITGWKSDFRYIYGDISSNLSSNSKLDPQALLQLYDLPASVNAPPAETLQMLFFSLQTCYSILIKSITQDLLQDIFNTGPPTHEDLLLGTFAVRCGIENYCCADWYCWPVFELERGFAPIMDAVRALVLSCRTPHPPHPGTGGDLIKQLYESMIPKELRRALGEFYTPGWLSESTLQNAVAACDAPDITRLSITDPACGSGTFLLQAIAKKRAAGCSLDNILSSIRGMDINPLAVLTAKTSYLLSILDLLDGVTPITLPVYNADILTLPGPAPRPTPEDFASAPHPASAVRSRIQQDRAAARNLPRADIIVGNPPWVNWEYMPASYRQGTQHLWTDHGLLSVKGVGLSFLKEDVSVLITYIVMDSLLKDGGVLGFVIRQGVFKSAQNGAGFRRFRLRDGTPVRVVKVADLSKIRVFGDAAAGAALFVAQKGRETAYPVPYEIWTRTSGWKSRPFDPCARLPEVMGQVTVREAWASPASAGDPASPWITAGREELDAARRVLGTNPYRARTGVFTGGANAVYWLNILGDKGGYVSVSNITARAKRKAEAVTAEVEKEFVYPLLRGGGVRKWRVGYDSYILCPHTPETKIRPVPQRELSRRAPGTLAYLEHFRDDLDARRGFAGWEKEIQRQEFHAVLRVGAYTFAPFKVVWRYISSRFICAVVGSVDDPWLGEKLLLPNEKIMYVGTSCADEAYYLCGMLSSSLVSRCVEGYMSPTSISAHVLDKLCIPVYDPADPRQGEIARLCRAGHGEIDISPFIREIDRLVDGIYGV